MVDIKKEFGIKVKKYRLYAKLTQESLAEKAGITPQTLSGIENGYGFPSYPVLCKMVDALNVNPAHLFTFPQVEGNTSNEDLKPEFLEDFAALNSFNRKTITHLMAYLRENQE